MTKEEIMEIVKMAGWSGIYTQWAEPTGEADWSPYKVSLTVPVTMEQIEAFVKLIAEKEREECAKIADSYADGLERNYSEIISDKIRARKQE